MYLKRKRILASFLVVTMIFSNAGVSIFAGSISNVARDSRETNSLKQKELSTRYYEQFKAERQLLLMGDEAKDAVAGAGAEKTSTDNQKETTSDDSLILGESKNTDDNSLTNIDENKNENKDNKESEESKEIKNADEKISTSSDAEDAEEDEEETTVASDVEEPEEDETTKAAEEEATATTSDAENENEDNKNNENNEEAEEDTATISDAEKVDDEEDEKEEKVATDSDADNIDESINEATASDAEDKNATVSEIEKENNLSTLIDAETATLSEFSLSELKPMEASASNQLSDTKLFGGGNFGKFNASNFNLTFPTVGNIKVLQNAVTNHWNKKYSADDVCHVRRQVKRSWNLVTWPTLIYNSWIYYNKNINHNNRKDQLHDPTKSTYRNYSTDGINIYDWFKTQWRAYNKNGTFESFYGWTRSYDDVSNSTSRYPNIEPVPDSHAVGDSYMRSELKQYIDRSNIKTGTSKTLNQYIEQDATLQQVINDYVIQIEGPISEMKSAVDEQKKQIGGEDVFLVLDNKYQISNFGVIQDVTPADRLSDMAWKSNIALSDLKNADSDADILSNLPGTRQITNTTLGGIKVPYHEVQKINDWDKDVDGDWDSLDNGKLGYIGYDKYLFGAGFPYAYARKSNDNIRYLIFETPYLFEKKKSLLPIIRKSDLNIYHDGWIIDGSNNPFREFKIAGLNVLGVGINSLSDPITLTNSGKDFFKGNETLKVMNMDVFSFDNVNGFESAFEDCVNLKTVQLGGHTYTGSLKNMFKGCKNLKTVDASKATFEVSDMEGMFDGCENLEEIVLPLSMYASQYGGANAKYLFRNCKKLKKIDITSDYISWTNFESCFENCESLESINVQKFAGKIENAKNMFYGCKKLKTIYVNTDVSQLFASTILNKANVSQNMFYGCEALQGAVGTCYNKDHTNYEFARLDFGSLIPGYLTCTKNDIYNNYFITIGKFDLINKSQITKIKLSGSYSSQNMKNLVPIYETDDGNKMYGYQDDTGLLYVYWHPNLSVNMQNNSSGFFANYTNVTEIDLSGWKMTAQNASNFFEGCEKLKTITFPSGALSLATNVSEMFKNCKALTSLNLTNLSLNKVTTMTGFLSGAEALTSVNFGSNKLPALSDASSMFEGCENLTTTTFPSEALANAINISKMYKNCKALTSLNLTNLSLNKVTTMTGFLSGAKALTSVNFGSNKLLALSDASSMFEGCEKLTTTTFPSGALANAINISKMYKNCKALTSLNLTNLNLNKVTTITGWLSSASELRSVNFGSNKLPALSDASGMFEGCEKLTTTTFPSGALANATNISKMYKDCTSLTSLNLTSLNFGKVTNMNEMFKGCTALATITVDKVKADLTSIDTSIDVFTGCTSLVGNGLFRYDADMTSGLYARVGYGYIAPGYFTCTDRSYLNGKKIYVASDWFNSTTKTKGDIDKIEIAVDKDLQGFDEHFLMDATKGTWGYIVGNTFSISFDSGLTSLYVQNDMSNMFSGYENVTEILGLSYLNTEEVTNMSYLFSGNKAISSIDLSGLNVGRVTNMSYMFTGDDALTNIIVGNNFGTAAENMSHMFESARGLTNVSFLGNFNTSSARDMSCMFASCSNMTEIDLADFAFEHVENARYMFRGDTALTTVKVNTNVREFGTPVVTGFTGTLTSGTETLGMFEGCINLVGGAGYAYTDLHTDGEFARVDYGGIMPGYFTINDYSLIPKIVLSKDWAASVTKVDCEAIQIIRGPVVGTIGTDLEEIELYDDTTHNGKVLAYYERATRTLKIIYGDTLGNTIDKIYSAVDFSGAFSNFTNLQYIQGFENIDTSETTNMSSLFKDDVNLRELNLRDCVLSNVEDASSFIENCVNISENNLYFGTAKDNLFGYRLRNAKRMFAGCNGFTVINLRSHRVTGIDDMEAMFASCSNVTQIVLPNGFGISATNEKAVFKNCSSLTDINADLMMSTRAVDMSEMFSGCTSITSLELNTFSTRNAEYMTEMFDGCVSLINIYSEDFDTGSLIDSGANMFRNCYSLNGGNGTTWSVYNDRDATFAKIDGGTANPGYFRAPNIYRLNKDWDYDALGNSQITRNDISKISFAVGSLSEPTSYDIMWSIPNSYGLVGYKVTNGSDEEVIIYADDVKPIYAGSDASYLFGEETDTSKMWTSLIEIASLSELNTMRVVTMEGMFMNSEQLSEFDLSQFSTSSADNMAKMFKNMKHLRRVDVSSFDTSNVLDMRSMFEGDDRLESVTLPNDFAYSATDVSYMFADDVNLRTANSAATFDLSPMNARRAVDMSYMFYNCASISNLVLPTRDFGVAATNFSHMFDGAENITTINTGRIDVSQAVDMSYMFANMEGLISISIMNWQTRNVTDMSHMFENDRYLTSISLPAETELVGVLDPSYMLAGLSRLSSITLRKFENAITLEGLLSGDNNLTTINIPDNFVGNARNLKRIFRDVSSLTSLDLRTWDTQYVATMSEMFAGCATLSTIYASALFSVNSVVESTNMFLGCVSVVGHEGTVYDSTHVDSLYARIDEESSGNPGYFTGDGYTFGPGWNYVAGRSKSEITKIEFKNAEGRIPTGDDNYAVTGGLKGVRVGTTLTFYKSKPTISIQLLSDCSHLFEGLNNVETIVGLSLLNSSNVATMSYMFADLPNLRGELNISSFDTRNVRNMASMFRNDAQLETLILPSGFGQAAFDMSYMFAGDENLNIANTELNKFETNNVKDFSHMFEDCVSMSRFVVQTSGNVWNVESAQTMKAMFKGMTGLVTGNAMIISGWDTSAARDMSEMFMGISNLQGTLNLSFNTASVSDMSSMFEGVENITSLNINRFDTRSVENMSNMFKDAKRLSGALNLSSFDTSRVRNMSHMFDNCNNLLGIQFSESLNTRQVTDMSYMFKNTYSLTNNYVDSILRNRGFNTSNVVDMSYMFASSSNISRIDLSDIDTTHVSNMSHMFAYTSNLENISLSENFGQNATDMTAMFRGSGFITLNATNLDTGRAENVDYMFADMANLITIEVSNSFVRDSIVSSDNMFLNSVNILGIAGTRYDSSYVDSTYAIIDGSLDSSGNIVKGYFTSGQYILYNNWYGSSANKNTVDEIEIRKYPAPMPTTYDEEWMMAGNLRGYRIGSKIVIYSAKAKDIYVAPDASGLFGDFHNVATISNLNVLDTSQVNNMSYMFAGAESLREIDLSNFVTASVSDMSYMFNELRSVEELDVSGFDTSNVINMASMFSGVERVKTLDVSRFDTSKVQSFALMFNGMRNVEELDVRWFDTKSATNMSYMFADVSLVEELETSYFDTSNVTNMAGMFKGAESLTKVSVESFDTSSVDNMASMFEGLKKIKDINVQNFDISNVDNLSCMFKGLASVSEIDIFGFKPESATNASSMFEGCSSLVTIYASAKFVLNNSVISTDMFRGDTEIVGGAGTVYDQGHIDGLYARIDAGTSRPGYFSGAIYTARLMANGGKYLDGSEEKTVRIIGDTTTKVFETPERFGYTFTDYYVGTATLSSTWDYPGDRNVVAEWEPKKVSFYFNAGGGRGYTPGYTMDYESGDINLNNGFVRDGYTFAGWSLNGEKVSDIESRLATGKTISDYVWSTYIKEKNTYSVVFVATWQRNTYDIIYDGNGGLTQAGLSTYSDVAVEYDVSHNLTTNMFLRDGWTFNGWSKESGDAERAYADKARFKLNDYKEKVVLYAKWIRDNEIYGELTLHGNGGLVNGVADDTIYLKRYNRIPKSHVENEGYNFINWASGSEVVSYPDICDFTHMEITAMWDEITYLVKYHYNDGTDYYDDMIATYNEAFKIATYNELFVPFGYEVDGWSDSPYTDVIKYHFGEEVINLTNEEGAIVDLYAIHSSKEYTINLHNYDPENGLDLKKKFTYNRNERLTGIRNNSYISTVSGIEYIFSGWSTHNNSNTVEFYDAHYADDIYRDPHFFGNSGAIDLYAVWSDKNDVVNLIFDANEGLINGYKNLTVPLGRGMSIPYPNRDYIKRTGYRFEKWVTEKNGTTEFNDLVLNAVTDTIVYADWSDGIFAVQYIGVNSTSGNMPMVHSWSCLQPFTIPNNAYVRTGYTFIGWDDDSAAKTVKYMPGDSFKWKDDYGGHMLRLYTVWAPNEYQITYYDVDNQLIGTNKLNYEKKADLLSNTNIYKGYTDTGFTYDDGSGNVKRLLSAEIVTKDSFNITDTTDINDGLRLYGQQEKEIYTIRYITPNGHFADGSTLYVATQNIAEPLKLPGEPINDDGKAFLGWGIREGDAVVPYESHAYDFDYDVTMEAIWQFGEYIAHLYACGGEFVDGTTDKKEVLGLGDITSKLELPRREGYVFDNYYVKGKPLTATWSYIEKQEMDVEARWKSNRYYVTYDGTMEGRQSEVVTGNMGVDIATYGETYKLRNCEYKRDGHMFVGWVRLSEEGNEKTLYPAGTEVQNLTTKDGDVVTYNAAWIPLRYMISYEKNFESETEVAHMPNSVYDYGFQGRLLRNRYVRSGYKFLGWALSTNSNVVYTDEASINLKDMYENNITLYAIWQRNEDYYGKLTLNGNGGLINGIESYEINLGVNEVIAKVTPERRGYKFTYWSTSSDALRQITYPERCEFSSMTLYANWEPITYKVRFYDLYDNDNSYEEIVATYSCPINLLDYTGHHGDKVLFAGWASLKTLDTPTFKADQHITNSNLSAVEGDVINLYALWKGTQYKINLHDTILGDRSREFTYGKGEYLPGITQKIATVSGIGYVFSGWATNSIAMNTIEYYDGAKADKVYDNQSGSEIDIYAIWRERANGALVVFDANGGTVDGDKRKSVRYAYDDNIVLPDEKTLIRKGYRFNHWEYELNGSTYVLSDNDVIDFVGDREYKAVWIPGRYKINYHKTGIGVSTISGVQISADGKYFEREVDGTVDTIISDNVAFKRDGYKFLGWDIYENATIAMYKPGDRVEALAGDGEQVDLYAVWEPEKLDVYYYDKDNKLIGTNSILVGKNIRLIPNTGIKEGEYDAGYTYEVGGQRYSYSSGQSVSAEDLKITKKDIVSQSSGGGLFGAPPSSGDGTIKLYGDVTPRSYLITFNANGGVFSDGSNIQLAPVLYGEAMSGVYPSTPPTKGTVEFLGWSVDGKEFSDSVYSYAESKTFYAIWDKEYKARLLANGGVYSDGSSEMIVPIKRRQSTDILEIPTREGYEFSGYHVGTDALKATWSYIVDDVTDVEANWTPHRYRVVYNSNGATGTMDAKYVNYGEEYVVATNSFVKAGYIFDGWRFNNTIIYREGDVVSNLTKDANDTVSLTAIWKPLTYDIVYHGNSGLTSSRLSVYKETGVMYGADHNLRSNQFVKTGFTFKGWALSTLSNTVYADGATIQSKIEYKNVIDLYAVWIRNTEKYGKLILHGNGGLINGVRDVEIDYRLDEPIMIPTLYRKGYEFVTWVDSHGTAISLPTVWRPSMSRPLEFWANWAPNDYTVRYYEREGAAYVAREDRVQYGHDYTIASTSIVSKPYNTNEKWYRYEDGVKVEHREGDVCSNLTDVDEGIINLYATFVSDRYTIILHDTNPERAGVDVTTNYIYGEDKFISSVTKKIATISGVRKVFAGWTISDVATESITYYDGMDSDLLYEKYLTVHALTSLSSPIELWPVWIESRKVINLTFDGNGGTVNGRRKWTVVFATGSEIVYPLKQIVLRKGSRFNETWLENPSDDSSIFNKRYVDFDKDKTIYAQWDDTQVYRINYVGVGSGVAGSMAYELKSTNRDVILTNNAYTRLGYTFAGWDICPDAKNVVYKDNETVPALGEIGDVINLYTVWEAKTYTISYYDYQDSLVATSRFVYGSNVQLGANTYIPRGFTDNGWSTHDSSVPNRVIEYSSGQVVGTADLGITDSTDIDTGLKLYGLVSRNAYIVKFDANGGLYNSGTVAATSSILGIAYYGDPIIYPGVPVATRTDIYGNVEYKTFNGYTVDGTYYWSATYDYTEPKVFVALWDEIPFAINFHKNEPVSPNPLYSNTASGTMTSQGAISGTDFYLKHNAYQIPGYEFIGWATASYTQYEAESMRESGSSLIIPDGPEHPSSGNANRLNFVVSIGNNIDLYALWARNKSRVKLVQNEAQGQFSIYDPYVVENGDPSTATFDGQFYATESEIYYDSYLSDYTLFNRSGLVRGTYTWTGYFTSERLAGVRDKENFDIYSTTGTTYTVSDVYRTIGDITLYPIWKNETKTITMYAVDRINPTIAVLPLATSIASFEWYNVIGPDGNPVEVLPEDCVFTGYVDAPYIDSFTFANLLDDNGKIFKLVALPEQVRIFDHWSENLDGTSVVSENKIYTGANTSIYAQVRFRDDYIVHYDPNGGTGVMADTHLVEGIEGVLATNSFIRSGYKFKNWLDADRASYNDKAVIESPSKSLTLFAQWQSTDDGGRSDGWPSSGGGGGGGGGGGYMSRSLNDGFLLQTFIPITDYTFKLDEFGLPIGIMLKRNSNLAQALLSSLEYVERYKLIEGDTENILLKNGFYNLQTTNGIYIYLIDTYGNMRTGFATIDPIICYAIDPAINKIIKLSATTGGKYYLFEGQTLNRGMLWTLPIVVNGVKYLFDMGGRVISAAVENSAAALSNAINNGKWSYNQIENTWSYYFVDSEGNINIYKNGVYPITAADNRTYYFLFDEKGIMKTGLVEYNGKTYYLIEEGPLKGAVYTGSITLNGKNYTFDASGVMVTALSNTEMR